MMVGTSRPSPTSRSGSTCFTATGLEKGHDWLRVGLGLAFKRVATGVERLGLAARVHSHDGRHQPSKRDSPLRIHPLRRDWLREGFRLAQRAVLTGLEKGCDWLREDGGLVGEGSRLA